LGLPLMMRRSVLTGLLRRSHHKPFSTMGIERHPSIDRLRSQRRLTVRGLADHARCMLHACMQLCTNLVLKCRIRFRCKASCVPGLPPKNLSVLALLTRMHVLSNKKPGTLLHPHTAQILAA
jgi:hypothetical protein